jgi:hypothetical protein
MVFGESPQPQGSQARIGGPPHRCDPGGQLGVLFSGMLF